MRTLVPGEWYILFKCSQCKARQILFPDLSAGRATLRATYKVECAKCGHADKYESENLERYQHPQNSDPKPIYGIAFFALLTLLRKGGMLRIRRLRRLA
jgi:DNA-directed RNA polymerase subunit M/transcription elongation factor TFIIS